MNDYGYGKYGYPSLEVRKLVDKLHRLSNEAPKSIAEQIEEIVGRLESALRLDQGSVEKIQKELDASKVFGEIMEKATQIIKKEKDMTRSKAIERVLDEYPELYAKYDQALLRYGEFAPKSD